MNKQKEPLSIIAVKTLLAVIIFTGVGTIIIGGGWLIGKQAEKTIEPENITKTKSLVPDNEKINVEIDIFKFIPEHSVIVQKKIEDIDGDSMEEIFLYYITDLREDSITGRNALMILKSNDGSDYKMVWEYDFGKLIYNRPEQRNDERILIYDKDTDVPKIGFVIDRRAGKSGSHVFVYFDKNKKSFGTIGILDENDKKVDSIDDVKIEDADGDGIQEIIKDVYDGQKYKWEKESYVYQAIKKPVPYLDNSKNVYRNEKFGYELEHFAYLKVYEKDEKIKFSYGYGNTTISASKKIAAKEIEDYKCIDGEKKSTGSWPYITSSACSKIQSENGFDIFKISYRNSHWNSSWKVYNLIKKIDGKNFMVIVINAQEMSADGIASSLKFIEE